ncbi:MAG TPA: putative Ig domain-containing protein [Nannocystis sp.]
MHAPPAERGEIPAPRPGGAPAAVLRKLFDRMLSAHLVLGVSLALTLDAPLVVECTRAPHDLPPGTIGVSYAATAVVTGGSGPYTWEARGLPPGLTLTIDPGTSVAMIAGIPTASGVFPVELTVTDASGQSTSAACGIVVIGHARDDDDAAR